MKRGSPGKLQRRWQFLAALLALIAAVAAGTAQAVEAPPEIAVDTRWEGTVEVRGPVTVREGAMLLVMPGTTVRFAASLPDAPGKAVLRVEGTLVAQGTPARPILFTSAAESPAPGDWWGIDFQRANERPNRLRHCRIEYATDAIHGAYSPLVLEEVSVRASVLGMYADREMSGGAFECDFSGNGTGVLYHQNAGFTLEKSRIADNEGAGIACVLGSSPKLLANRVTGNAGVGISCVQGSSPVIGATVISGSPRGVHVEFKSQPAIIRNEIVDNGIGVEVVKLAFPKITANLIARNDVGIYCNYSGYPEVRENNILDNREFGLVLGDNMSIVMEKIIPFRDKGRNYDTPPVDPELLPAQSRKTTPLDPPEEGIVDARGNWWGEAGTAEAASVGEDGNVSFIEDFRDKPDTYYQDRVYPRDTVAFAPWETARVEEAGLPGAKYSGVRGKVLRGGAPVAGARVHAFPWSAEPRKGEGGSYSAPTGEDGTFSLNLAPGDALLEARKTAAGFPHLDPQPGDLVGTSGPEPVPVREGAYVELTIEVGEVPPAGVMPSPSPAAR